MAYRMVYEKSANLFKFDRTKNRYVANLASLGCNGIDSKAAQFFQPIERNKYGFVLVSSGKKIVMYLIGTNKIKSDFDPEDYDVKSWVFKSLRGEQVYLEILNDE